MMPAAWGNKGGLPSPTDRAQQGRSASAAAPLPLRLPCCFWRGSACLSAQLCMCAREDSGPVRCLPCIARLGQGWPCPVGNALSLRLQQEGGTPDWACWQRWRWVVHCGCRRVACKVGPASMTVSHPPSSCLIWWALPGQSVHKQRQWQKEQQGSVGKRDPARLQSAVRQRWS